MMLPIGEAVAAAAEALIGAPFRLHGRNPKTGIDCIGVVILSLASGADIHIDPGRYGLRNLDISAGCDAAKSSRLIDLGEANRSGDIIMVKAGPAAFHLLVAGFADQLIHAHAGLRTVVAMPGPVTWPIIRTWRPVAAPHETAKDTMPWLH